MLTWAIAWMSVQMERAGKGFYEDSLVVLLYISIIADAVIFGVVGWTIFK